MTAVILIVTIAANLGIALGEVACCQKRRRWKLAAFAQRYSESLRERAAAPRKTEVRRQMSEDG